jgi:hypothetical protein
MNDHTTTAYDQLTDDQRGRVRYVYGVRHAGETVTLGERVDEYNEIATELYERTRAAECTHRVVDVDPRDHTGPCTLCDATVYATAEEIAAAAERAAHADREQRRADLDAAELSEAGPGYGSAEDMDGLAGHVHEGVLDQDEAGR